jgi:very-short-patch-repair endonuclease
VCVGEEHVADDGRVVTGERIPDGLADRARELRREMSRVKAMLWQALRGCQPGGWKVRRRQIIDGDIQTQQRERDQARGDTLASRGIRVLRVSADDVLTNLNNHTQKRLSLQKRGWGKVP